jgi:hypothetical protein
VPERRIRAIRAVDATSLAVDATPQPHWFPDIVPGALSATVTDRDIACRAYELYEERGRTHGHDLGDWLQAERELLGTLRSTAA